MDKVTLTIDDKQVTARTGMTVLEAAKESGIYIPTLCYHPALKPFGACRLCVVEIEKMRGLPISCATAATDGMVVRTNTPQLQDFRRGVLELILTEHPRVCLICDQRDRCQPFTTCLTNAETEHNILPSKNTRCELQQVCDYVDLKEIKLPCTDKQEEAFWDEPLIARDYNRCILCGRCVRICNEVRGATAIAFVQRGSKTVVRTAFGRPLKESGCTFCGLCVEVCPTSALMDKAAISNPVLEREAVTIPCHYACPAEIDVPLYVYLAGKGKYKESLAIVREKVPFPGVLGRVCIHPCEQACRHGEVNKPIAIKDLKRFVADRDIGEWKQFSKRLPPTGKKVAIVGSGPAGLTAGYYLAKQGHSVTVFEQFSRAGGMMRVGIPDYRLPPTVLDGEIEEIERAGVDIKLDTKIESIDSLFQQNYDAIFLAIGAHRGIKIGVEGEDSPGVMDGATFLRDVSLGNKVQVGDRVAVIGGGNVAIDSARTALRLGAKDIRVIYRRTEAEMPASPEEFEAAREEGIEFVFLAAPLKIAPQNGRLQMTCIHMELGEPDESGRRRPVPIKGSEFMMDFSAIIAAVGQTPEIPNGFSLKTGRGNIIQVNPGTLETSRPGVWAGGDVTSGPKSVIEAIAAGRRAAVSIDRYLGGDGVIDEKLTEAREFDAWVEPKEDFATQERVKMPCLPLGKREGNFAEVELGFAEEQGIREGKRCFNCGIRLRLPTWPCPPQ
ncbi:MAG: FAD-dependent oxidoreductase [Chloroflexi bacterium]|nr:FAD-dependent oxidoreductase [Chloroflexota bacterium]